MDDICYQILKLLPFKTIYAFTQVCKAFSNVFNNNLLWKDLYETNFGNFDVLENDYKLTCRLYYEIVEYRINKSKYGLNKYINNTKIDFCKTNNFKIIPTEIGLLNNLEHLYLCEHQISIIPIEICKLPKLKNLKLVGNIIEIIPPEIHNLTSLIVLELWKNKIQNIPTELYLMNQLVKLKLNENKIKHIPIEICNLTNLTNLNLSNNEIETIPTEIRLSNIKIFEYDSKIKI